MLRGKGLQVLSFVAMLLIFVAVISCSKDNTEGVCAYRDEMILGSAAVMMGLMGMKLVNRNKMKKKLDKKIFKALKLTSRIVSALGYAAP
mgnify:CR=1 FL=1